jgi:histone-lysine N-methyltransferase EZH2
MLCSCLIARNLLSGLRTCIEVSSYMHEGGASMLHRSMVAPSSITEDNGKADTEFTVSIPIFFFLACHFPFDFL